ncbi:MAG: antibiotic biosynthesis monooxygenase [Rhodobacteraceae bacterium]|nr:antibiotic biosynthesis monooxygenase [Paracoccaceae bacterium]
MSIIVIVELQVKRDHLNQVHPLFTSLLPQTRNSEGNEGVTVHRDQDNPTSIILIEKWACREQYETYNCWRAKQGDLETLARLLQSPPKRRFMEHLTL